MRVLFRNMEKPDCLRYIEADFAEINETEAEDRQYGRYELYIEAIDWSLSAFFADRETPSQLLRKALTDGYMDLTAYPVLFDDLSDEEDGKNCSFDDCMDCDNTNCVYNPRHDN